MAFVEYEKRNHVAYITLNRPDRMNALGPELSRELADAEREFAEDDDARVGVYTGAGERAFCAGLDLKAAAESGGPGGNIARGLERRPPEIAKPTIAAVNGYAYGGGFEKAAACDIRICSENAVFALSEVKVGLCAPSGSFVLPRLIGLSNAMWLLLGGEPIDAREAHRMGLVSKVVPQAELMPTATQMAETISENAPLAVRATRTMAHLGIEMPLEYGRRMGTSLIASVWGSEDAVEGAKAFAEKRKPVWKMR